jgi:hypothetical protein
MTTRNIGEEGFRWFIGTVEDRDDPLKLGRVRVRVMNMHSLKQSRAGTENLPWAYILNSPNSASLTGVGISPTGIQVGSTVVGFFMDGNEGNNPVIMGTLVGIQGSTHDVSPEAREINTIKKEPLGPEPQSPYASKYPYNKVVRTEKGHVIEIDDTPNQERIHVYHKSGTYFEIDKDGKMVTKVVDSDVEVVVKNRDVYIGGNANIQVKGNVNLTVDGNMDTTVGGNMNTQVGGTYTVNSGGNMKFTAPKIDLN